MEELILSNTYSPLVQTKKLKEKMVKLHMMLHAMVIMLINQTKQNFKRYSNDDFIFFFFSKGALRLIPILFFFIKAFNNVWFEMIIYRNLNTGYQQNECWTLYSKISVRPAITSLHAWFYVIGLSLHLTFEVKFHWFHNTSFSIIIVLSLHLTSDHQVIDTPYGKNKTL